AYWRGNTNSAMAITPQQMAALVSYFQPRFQLFLSPAALMREAEASILRASGQQMKVLEYISHHPRARIAGVAGSGKTLLAVERALRFAHNGQRTLLTCFNRAL